MIYITFMLDLLPHKEVIKCYISRLCTRLV